MSVTFVPLAACDGFVNRGDLRHADAGDDPRRADRSRADADFHRVGAGRDQVARSVARGHVAGHDVDVPASLDLADRLDHVGRVAVGAVDDQEIDVLGDQAPARSKSNTPTAAPTRSRPCRSLAACGNRRIMSMSLIVISPVSLYIFVNQQKLLDLFCHQNLLSFLKRYGPRAVTRWSLVITSEMGRSLCSRNRRSRRVMMPTSLPFFDDRDAGDFRLLHRLVRGSDASVRRQRHGVDDDAVGRALHLVDLFGLPLDRHVLVDHAEPAFLGQRDRHRAFGHRVHRRAEDRDVHARCAR